MARHLGMTTEEVDKTDAILIEAYMILFNEEQKMEAEKWKGRK